MPETSNESTPKSFRGEPIANTDIRPFLKVHPELPAISIGLLKIFSINLIQAKIGYVYQINNLSIFVLSYRLLSNYYFVSLSNYMGHTMMV